MAIPDYQSCMLPLYEFYDKREHAFRDTVGAGSEFDLSKMSDAKCRQREPRRIHQPCRLGTHILESRPAGIHPAWLQ